MRVSWKWLESMVDLQGFLPQQVADILTQGGVETSVAEFLHPGFSHIIIGEIVSVEDHAQADALRVCTVDVGKEALVSIVSGADNFFAGDKVALAQPGSVLPDSERVIAAIELHGLISHGMLCAEKELGLDAGIPVGLERSRDGVLILPSDAPTGGELATYLMLDDWVLDLELYPNRSDCLAMINVAREVGALIGRKAVLPDPQCSHETWPAADQEILIEATDWSGRYSALIAENSIIEPSPMWLQNRLRAAGIRPISSIVDLTNYCMMERGQPLHAFDLDKLNGPIRVRRARAGEQLTTLDGVRRDLDEDMLVIADDSGAVAIAGVMGGLETEVTEATRRVLFESAHFQGACVRRTSRRLGLRSESSLRFEKGVDITGTVSTLERLAGLLVELGCGVPAGFTECVVVVPEETVISLDIGRIARVLGVEVDAERAVEVLRRQGFVCLEAGDSVYHVTIPSYRQDLVIEEDLIEEIARMIGYDKIPATLPRGEQTQGTRSGEQIMRRRVRRLLIEAGMDEVITYAFVSRKEDAVWGRADRQVSLLNPLRDDMSVMRTSLIPGLLGVAARNMSRQGGSLALFEVGNVYRAREQEDRALPEEEMKVAGVACGRSAKHWSQVSVEYGFFYMKGVLEAVAGELGVDLAFRDMKEEALMHPGRSAVVLAGEEELGFFGEIHPHAAGEWDLRCPVVFELDLGALARAAQALGHGLEARVFVAKAYPRFPAMQRDLAVVVPVGTPAGAVEDKICLLGGELLTRVDVFDVYTGPPVPAGHKSVAFSLVYQSAERTLTEDEVNEANQSILTGIQEEFGAERRKS